MVRPRAVGEYSTRGGTSRYTSRWTSPSRSSSRKCGDSGVRAATAAIGLIGAGNIGSTVAKLAVDAGYDIGPLSEGWRYQRDTAANAYSTDESFEHPGPADAERLTSLLARAKRYRDM